MCDFSGLYKYDPLHQVAILAIAFGILTVIVGLIASKLVGPYFKVDLPELCAKWNVKKVMQWSLFATGVLIYLLLEYTGVFAGFAKYYSKQ
jgi:hypothetical protein